MGAYTEHFCGSTDKQIKLDRYGTTDALHKKIDDISKKLNMLPGGKRREPGRKGHRNNHSDPDLTVRKEIIICCSSQKDPEALLICQLLQMYLPQKNDWFRRAT